MSIWPEISRRGAVLAALFIVFAGALTAQPVELPEGPVGRAEELALQLTEAYQILPVDGGVALVPKSQRNGIRRIEIKGEQAFVNGAEVPATVLKSWLQQDADPILQLLALPPAERRSLFDLPPDAAAPPLEAVSPEPPSVEASEAEVSEGGASEGGAEEGRSEDSSATSSAKDSAGVASVVVEAPELPAQAERDRRSTPVHSEDRVVVGRSLTVERDEIAKDVVVIGSNLRIEGEVLGDALAVGGSVTVDGRVSGDVASVGGGVHLEDGARIHGNVVSVGGGIDRDPGAQVFGEITEVALGGKILDFSSWGDRDWGFEPRIHTPSPFRGFWRTTGGLAKIFFLAVFACLVFLTLQPQVRRAERIAAAEPWKAGLVGLAAIIGFVAVFLPLLVIVCIVLTITIIGIPVALLLLFGVTVAAIALPLMGYATAALRCGGIVKGRFPGRFGEGVVLVLVGVVAIELCSFLAHILGGGGWFLALPVFLFAFFGWLVRFSAWTVGLGAVLLSFQGRSDAAFGPPPPLPPLPRFPSEEDPHPRLEEDLEALDRDLGDLQDELEEELMKAPAPASSASLDPEREDSEPREPVKEPNDIVPPSPS